MFAYEDFNFRELVLNTRVTRLILTMNYYELVVVLIKSVIFGLNLIKSSSSDKKRKRKKKGNTSEQIPHF